MTTRGSVYGQMSNDVSKFIHTIHLERISTYGHVYLQTEEAKQSMMDARTFVAQNWTAASDSVAAYHGLASEFTDQQAIAQWNLVKTWYATVPALRDGLDGTSARLEALDQVLANITSSCAQFLLSATVDTEPKAAMGKYLLFQCSFLIDIHTMLDVKQQISAENAIYPIGLQVSISQNRSLNLVSQSQSRAFLMNHEQRKAVITYLATSTAQDDPLLVSLNKSVLTTTAFAVMQSMENDLVNSIYNTKPMAVPSFSLVYSNWISNITAVHSQLMSVIASQLVVFEANKASSLQQAITNLIVVLVLVVVLFVLISCCGIVLSRYASIISL